MPTRAFVTIEDHSGEVSTTSFNVQDVTALNFGSVTQDIDEVKDAILTVIEGEVRQVGFTKTYPESFAAVANASAQRERKWLVVYRDTTQDIFNDGTTIITNPGFGKLFTMEIATADLNIAEILLPNSDDMNVGDSGGVATAFIAAIEANVRSPYNSQATSPTIEVVRVTSVGRNN